MEFNWKNWSNGQKLIFVSSTVAVVSLLLPWADMGLISVNGFAQQGLFALSFFYLSALSSIKIKSNQASIRFYIKRSCCHMLHILCFIKDR